MTRSTRHVRTAAAVPGRRERACNPNPDNNARLPQAGD